MAQRLYDANMNQEEVTKVVIMDGFSQEEIFSVMRAVKGHLGQATEVAFAMATPHSLEMKLKEIISDVKEEHAYFKKQKQAQQETPDKS